MLPNPALNGLVKPYVTMVCNGPSDTLGTSLVPLTAGGLSISSQVMTNSTNSTEVKSSGGQIYGLEIFNNSTSIGYLKIYDTATSPTPGAGTPMVRLMVPAGASGAGVVRSYENGLIFANGIGYCFTGGIADNDTTSVSASEFIVNIYYK